MGPLHRTAIVMSRLPRLIDPRSPWLRGLRAALRRLQQRGDTLVIVDGVAGSEFVRRGAERLAIPIETIAITSEVNASPSLDNETIAHQDHVLVQSAQTVLALGVRTRGNIHRALVQKLASCGHVEIIDIEDLQTHAVREDLIERGAKLWSPTCEDQLPLVEPVEVGSKQRNRVYEIVPFPSTDEWVYLSHTTRACPGPWPDQTPLDYIDSLLDNAPGADHSAIAALKRILIQRRLLASPLTNRGGNAVVCFTEVPLSHLPALHQFRTHRMRWDFEPYGICIRRDWLQHHGARPVAYGDESSWNNLPESDRPFFQLNAKSEDAKPQPIDWSIEQEWRYIGDVDLQSLPPDQALVFVPSSDAAMRLANFSPWPITLWPGPT